MKRCGKCDETLPFTAFHRNKDSYQSYCKACKSAHGRQRLYGLRQACFVAITNVQRARCGICKKPSTERRLVVDHDHASGKVRGLLCNMCNTALGLFEDCAVRMSAAMTWVDQATPNDAERLLRDTENRAD